MSNEELSAAIRAGEHSMLPALWAQVEKFAAMQAGKVARKLNGRGGVTAEDLYQSGFLALVAAAETHDPDKGAFLTWYGYHLKKAFAEAIGRTRNPLDLSSPLDDPIPGTDDLTTADTLDDPAAEQAFENAEESIWREKLHDDLEKAMQALPERQADVLRRRYYLGQSLSEAGAGLGITKGVARTAETNGLRTLRRKLPGYREQVIAHSAYYSTGFQAWKSGGSVEERTIERLERLGLL